MSAPSITEVALAFAREQPNALAHIASVLGAKQMSTVDHIRTKHEAIAYIESGDSGAARALIQHAKRRRELWAKRSNGLNGPKDGRDLMS